MSRTRSAAAPATLSGRTGDWQNSLRLAADLALLGIVVTVLSLPVLTAGAAVATGSAAVHHLVGQGRWPSFADLWAVFRRRLAPGLAAGPVVLVSVLLVALDVAALRRGAVPGGAAMVTVVLLVAALGAGLAGLTAVEAGRTAMEPPRGGISSSVAGVDSARGGMSPSPAGVSPSPAGVDAAPGGRGALRRALALAGGHPVALPAATGSIVVAAVLALFVHPALIPVLAGYVLFALHVVVRRAAAGDPVAARG